MGLSSPQQSATGSVGPVFPLSAILSGEQENTTILRKTVNNIKRIFFILLSIKNLTMVLPPGSLPESLAIQQHVNSLGTSLCGKCGAKR